MTGILRKIDIKNKKREGDYFVMNVNVFSINLVFSLMETENNLKGYLTKVLEKNEMDI
jgi:hypothetical protein